MTVALYMFRLPRFHDISEKHIVIAGLAARLLVFLLIIWFFGVGNLSAFNDSSEYVGLAHGLAAGHGFMVPNPLDLREVVRPPGYPAFLAIFLFFGLPLWLASLVQLIAASFVPFIVMRLARHLGFNERVGRTAGWFTALEPLQVYYSVMILTDAFAVLFFILGVFLLVRFWQERRMRDLIGSALIIGGANYIRPTVLFLYILVPFCIFLAGFMMERARWRVFLRYAVLYGVVFYLTLVPWMFRNYTRFGAFKFVSGLERQLYDYAAATVRATAERVPYDVMYERMHEEITPLLPQPPDLKRFANGPVLAERAKAIILAHPREYIKLYLMSLQTLLASGNYHYFLAEYHIIAWPSGGTESFTMLFSSRDFGHALARLKLFLAHPYGLVALIGKLFWAAVLILALIGAYLSWRRYPQARLAVILYLSLIAYLAVVTLSLVGGVEARHRIFLDPISFIFMAAGVSAIREWYRLQRGGSVDGNVSPSGFL